MSALTHRRMTAFLGLLGLWTIWLFVAPNLAVRTAQSLAPVSSFYDQESRREALRWETEEKKQAEVDDYWRHSGANSREVWDALPEARRQELREGDGTIRHRWDVEYYSRLKSLYSGRRNQMRSQQRLVTVLSAISPLGATDFLSMDLARTGLVQQERMENALNAYLISLNRYVQDKRRSASGSIWRGVDLTDFSWFTYQNDETLGKCLSRNVLHILNLALLAVLGFVGAYVAILRYDVR